VLFCCEVNHHASFLHSAFLFPDDTRKSMIHLQLSPFARNWNPLHSPSSLGN
jgi:hypothetical protein